MKKILLTAGAAVALVVFLFGMNTLNYNSSYTKSAIGAKNILPTNEAVGFALVELFTSEGCSSCPPADELVNKLAKEKKQHVFILSYHVDYWNRLGWKDKFSKAEFTKRQQQYAAYFNKDGVYTPQIVVNGKTEFVGSDESKLYSAINNTVSAAYTSPIQITATVVSNAIAVSYKVEINKTASLKMALVQLAGSSQVANGENEGRFLQHTNIVTDIKTINAGTIRKEIVFEVPVTKGFSAADYKVVAFLQNNDGTVIAATESTIK